MSFIDNVKAKARADVKTIVLPEGDEPRTVKAAAAIRRIVLKKAVDAYWNAKTARNNGCIEIWKDPELGDPAFYAECIAPLVARLDPYAGRVKPDMTDEDVMDVYENAAKDWLNIEFVVSGLRTRYLERTLVNAE